MDDEGRAVINSQPEIFEAMLTYIQKDRAWLPSVKKGNQVKRELVETEIRKWRVDVGLARPSVLITKVARDF